MEVKTTYNYKVLNVMRFICAIFVMMIHTMAFYSISEDLWIATSMGICRIAVPFFFLITGYFYYDLKSEKDRKKRIVRYSKIYFKCVILELVILLPIILPMMKMMPVSIILFKFIIMGVTGTLWYMSSMIIGMMFLEFFTKRKKYIFLVILSLIVFGFGLMGDSYAGFFTGTFIENLTLGYKKIFMMMQVGITMSLPFLTIGYFINKLNLVEQIKRVKILFFVIVCIFFIETFALFKSGIAVDANMVISMLVFAPLIFISLLKSKIHVSDKISNYTRRASFLVYILHQPILMWLYKFNIPNFQISLYKFLITLVVTLIIVGGMMKFKFDKLLLKK
ncbi:MAG: acyltransferase family protein [Sarcina sp.]